MLVVDCPSQAFMPALISSPQLLECASGAKQDKGVLGVGVGGVGGALMGERWPCQQRACSMAGGAWLRPSHSCHKPVAPFQLALECARISFSSLTK